jgi:hypothetical protein
MTGVTVGVNIFQRVRDYAYVSPFLFIRAAIAAVTIGTAIFSRVDPMPLSIFIYWRL